MLGFLFVTILISLILIGLSGFIRELYYNHQSIKQLEKEISINMTLNFIQNQIQNDYCNSTTGNSEKIILGDNLDIGSIYGDFFKGYVRFIALSDDVVDSLYSLVSNGSIIAVNNGVHIRLLENQVGIFPDSFEIIAPMDGVKVLRGCITKEYIHYLPASEYLKLRKYYSGV